MLSQIKINKIYIIYIYKRKIELAIDKISLFEIPMAILCFSNYFFIDIITSIYHQTMTYNKRI